VIDPLPRCTPPRAHKLPGCLRNQPLGLGSAAPAESAAHDRDDGMHTTSVRGATACASSPTRAWGSEPGECALRAGLCQQPVDASLLQLTVVISCLNTWLARAMPAYTPPILSMDEVMARVDADRSGSLNTTELDAAVQCYVPETAWHPSILALTSCQSEP